MFAGSVHLKCPEKQQKSASSVVAAPGRLFWGLWSAQIRSEDLSVYLFWFGRGSGGILPLSHLPFCAPSPGFTLRAQSTGAPLTFPSPLPTPWTASWKLQGGCRQNQVSLRRGVGSATPGLTTFITPAMALMRGIFHIAVFKYGRDGKAGVHFHT